MAALPESNTKRYWLVYTVGPHEHRILMRVADSIEDEDAVGEAESAWNLLVPTLSTDTILVGLEVAERGSNVRNPVSIEDPIPGTLGGALAEIQRPREWTIKSRSRDGRRGGVGIFGVNQNTPTTWELAPITEDDLAAFRLRLNVTTGMWLSISGLKPLWYDRVTVGYNDHWVDVMRG